MDQQQEISCTNDTLIELEFIRKCMHALLEFKNYTVKLTELNAITDDKLKFELNRIEQRFSETVHGHEILLNRFINLQEEWTTAPDDYSTFCDPNMDGGDQTYITNISQINDSLNSSFNSISGKKEDPMSIAAAEVVEHLFQNGLYMCGWPSCEYQTSSRRHITNHKLVHTGDGEFNCSFPECGRRFKSRDELNDHQTVHNSDHPYPCVWHGCNFRSQTTSSLKAHMRVHMERKWRCEFPDCNEEYDKQQDLEQHKSLHDPEQLAQAIKAEANQQQQQHQQIAQIINTSGETVIQQSLSPEQQIQGQQVTLIQIQPNSALAHKTLAAAQGGTITASPTNQTAVAYSTAIHVAGSNTVLNQQVFKCNNANCNAYFSTLYDHKQHMMQHTKTEKPYRCDYPNCNYSACSKTALNEHKVTHSNERNYCCPIENCGRRYKTRKGLWDHSHTHRTDKPYMCNYPNCSYRCVSSSYLRSHMRAHKDANLVMQAPVATQQATVQAVGNAQAQQPAPQQQQFFAPGTIIQHPNGVQEFICGIVNCGKSYDNQVAYLNHVKTHAPSALIPQQAPVPVVVAPPAPPPPPPAPKRTRQSANARFKCEFQGCNAAYKLKRNLKDHMIRHTILEKPYRCDWPGCDYGSYKSTNVAKHKSVHSDERKFGCDFLNCDKKFKTREGLRKHMLSHHRPIANNSTLSTPIKMDL